MAQFIIKAISVNPSSTDTLMTKCEFTYDDTRVVIVDIPHFRGSSLQQINDNIDNRLKSEWSKLKASDLTLQIANGLKIFIDQIFPASQE